MHIRRLCRRHLLSASDLSPASFRVGFVLGGPGTGKSLQCGKLCDEWPHLSHISVGNVLREAVGHGISSNADTMSLRPLEVPNGHREIILDAFSKGSILPAHVTVNLLQQDFQRRANAADDSMVSTASSAVHVEVCLRLCVCMCVYV